ncbi:DUF4240 domain-containing protein [Nonomuraea sp. SYSU D8015]|uniref:DUF4240 domain-containing protein n=1 Tax=Nonomuraea sp. SYSU D8015 TaxID=2593644 RepID=UPI003FA5E057
MVRHCQPGLAPCSVMEVDEFWLFLRRSREVTSDPDERLRWLALHLGRSPLARIVDFQVLLNQMRRRSDTYDMWEAANLIFGGFWAFPLECGHLGDWILRSRGRDVPDGDEELPARVQGRRGGV